jgi:site-specific recombinase XerC
MTETAISPLRRRMIEDMTVRNFFEKTRNDYIRHVKTFTAFLGRSPDRATPEDLRLFQVHQTETGVRPPTINGSVAALRFFFTVTLDRSEMTRHLTFVREPRKVPVVLSPEEVARFLEAAPGPMYKAALSAAYGAGLRVSEVVSLKCPTSTASAWCSGSSKARAAKTAMPCCHRSCSSCCATGIASHTRGSGCFPDRTRSSISPRASSPAPFMPPPMRPRSPSG